MATFKAYFKKEILESKRLYRYLIILIAMLFLSLSGPIIFKLLPRLLKGNNMEALTSMLVTNKLMIIQSFIGDLFEMGTLVMVFTFCGLISDELVSQKLVFPFSKNASSTAVVLAKVLHYSILIIAGVFTAFSVNFYYTNILYEGTAPSIGSLCSSAALISLFFIFNLVLTMLFSLLFKKGIAAGITTLLLQYTSIMLAGIKGVKDFVPYSLVNIATSFSFENASKNILLVSIYTVIIILTTIYLLDKAEKMQ